MSENSSWAKTNWGKLTCDLARNFISQEVSTKNYCLVKKPPPLSLSLLQNIVSQEEEEDDDEKMKMDKKYWRKREKKIPRYLTHHNMII